MKNKNNTATKVSQRDLSDTIYAYSKNFASNAIYVLQPNISTLQILITTDNKDNRMFVEFKLSKKNRFQILSKVLDIYIEFYIPLSGLKKTFLGDEGYDYFNKTLFNCERLTLEAKTLRIEHFHILDRSTRIMVYNMFDNELKHTPQSLVSYCANLFIESLYNIKKYKLTKVHEVVKISGDILDGVDKGLAQEISSLEQVLRAPKTWLH